MLRELFKQPPQPPAADPFIQPGDTVLPNGNSKSKDLPPTSKNVGVKVFDPRPKDLDQNRLELDEHGDPEQGAGKGKKKRKKVSHKDRALKYLQGLGWSTDWVERWVVTRDGFGFYQDFRGMWDVRCRRPGQPELRVNVCGDRKDMAAHLRKFCKDKTLLRFREDLMNPNVICALLGHEPVKKGKQIRYEPIFQRLTIRDLEGVLSRRRKVA